MAMSTTQFSRRASWWLVGLGIWTIFPVLTAVQAAFYSAYIGDVVKWDALLPIRLADWYTCAIFTPICFWLVRRFPVGGGEDAAGTAGGTPAFRDARRSARSGRNAVTQLAFVMVAVAAKFAVYVPLGRLILPSETWRLDMILARKFVQESIAFWVLLAIVHAIEYHRRDREREVHTAKLEAELASARLDALTAQLQPHFLFNTLNSISTLMRRDVDAAEEMLLHLGDLLRRTLAQRERHEVTLGEELEVLRHYLDIMKIRFQDRLVVRIDVAPGIDDALVPNLVLQPLAENAIRHGIARKPGAGLLELTARRAGDALEVSIRDDGEGSAGTPGGIGLTNTRRRLHELYGDAQSLELEPLAGGGMRVTLRIPLRVAAAAA